MAQETVKESAVVAKTKNGIEIRYREQPRRYYEIRNDQVSEHEDWVECDFSMSEVGDVLSKGGGMLWWGMSVGLQAVVTMIERNYIRVTQDGQIVVMGEAQWELPTALNLMARAKEQKITVNDVRDKAGDRGNSVHKALEAWVEKGTIPVPDFYGPDEEGFVRGLLAFLNDMGELKSKPQSEIMVGSVANRIAGRYDLEVVLQGARFVTKKATPSWKAEGPNHHSAKGPEYTEYKGRTLFDLKTSKDVYLSHKLQMTGYEGCRIECGMPKTDQQLVVVVNDDGTYKVGEADTTWEEFLTVLDIARMAKEKG
jgi:hypothetical protein